MLRQIHALWSIVKFTRLFLTLFLLPALLFFSASAQASDVTLAWDPNTESDLAGYKIYYKTGSPGAPYDGIGADQGNSGITAYLYDFADQSSPQYTITGLDDNTTYYLVVTAFNETGDESGYSNEVQHTTPAIQINQAPVLDAGTDQIVSMPDTGFLSGTVSDDGLPSGSSLMVLWDLESGPDTVSIYNQESIDTEVSFTTAGTYVFTLSAYDGELWSYDSVTVTVTAPDTENPTTPSALQAQAQSNTRVTLTWTASTDNVAVDQYIVHRNDSTLGSVASTSFEDIGLAPATTYTYWVEALDPSGNSSGPSTAVSFTTPENMFEIHQRVAQSTDDAEEYDTGAVYTNSSDLELTYEGNTAQVVGIRFGNIELPRGAQISSAYIEFQADETGADPASVSITAQDADSAEPFTTASYNISDRLTLSDTVEWQNIAPWNAVDENHRTPDLTLLIQQIVDRGGWMPGNAMAFIMTGSGTRTAESFDGEPENAPLLHISYSVSQPTEFTINAACGSGGNISPSGNISLEQGANQTFYITPDSQCIVKDVSIDGASIGPVTSYTFQSISENHTIDVEFELATSTITASAGENGMISPYGTTNVKNGATVAYAIIPDDHYRIKDVSVDGASVGAVTGYTFDNIQTDHTIAALFEPVSFNITAISEGPGSLSPSGTIQAEYGSTQTFGLIPDAGSRIIDVLVDGDSIGPVSEFTFELISSDHTIQAVFGTSQHTLTASAGPNGTIEPVGTLMVETGGTRTFNITPSAGYTIETLMVDGIQVDPVSTYGFINITADHTISATFEAAAHVITASAQGSGMIEPSGPVTVTAGGTQAFVIIPDEGSIIKEVLINGDSIGPVSEYVFQQVTVDQTIEVVFETRQFAITAQPGTNGTISPAAITVVDYNASRTYTITPDAGFKVKDVVVDDVSVGALSTYTFENITENHTISATFEAAAHVITASTQGSGMIEPSGPVTVTAGGTQAFVIIPDDSSVIKEVLINGDSIGPVSEYVFQQVTMDQTIEAVFETKRFAITAQPGTNGTLSPAGTTMADYNGSLTYTVTPDAGFKVKDVVVDNVSVGALSTYTFENITENHTISATFEAAAHVITASAQGSGMIEPSGPVTVTADGTQAFVIIPDDGSIIKEVLINGDSIGPVSEYVFQQVTVDQTIEVVFETRQFAITAQPGTNGTISPAGTTMVNSNASLTYTITPDAGFKVKDVVVDNVSVGAVSTYRFSNITADHTISATFEAAAHVITASAQGSGMIEPSGPVTVTAGGAQAFVIIPDPDGGSVIKDVRINGDSIGPVSEYVFQQVTMDQTIEAVFETKRFAITAQPGTNGTLSPAGTTMADYNGSLTYTITPSAGFKVKDVVVDNVSVGALSTYTFENITENHTISATFEAAAHVITASAQGSGMIEPSGPVTVTAGGAQAFVIIPDDSSIIKEVLINGDPIGPVSEYVFQQVTMDQTIEAVFETKRFAITAQPGTNGTISPAGTTMADYNGSLTYTITPSAGFKVKDVVVDNVSVGAVSTYTLSNITANHSLSASFEALSTQDTTPPELSITRPTTRTFYFTTRSGIYLGGSASDASGIKSISWSNPSVGSGTASGTTSWSTEQIKLKRGFNDITVTAMDNVGNRASRTITVYRWSWY